MTLYHFLEDGFTHETKVYMRGEMLEVDTDLYPHFLWDVDDQMKVYGKVYWQEGPWSGALFDTEDPDLTPAEREKLEEANEAILAKREEAKATPPAKEPDPEKKPPLPKRRARSNPAVVIKNSD